MNVTCLSFPLKQLGIGNTTAAASLVSAITGHEPSAVCGRGSGLDDTALAFKAAMVGKALEVNAELVASGPAGILQGLGGLEIAAMVGAYLQASVLGIPVMVDGFISGAAALVALRIDPSLERCLFWSHRSDEKGAAIILNAISGRDEQGGWGACGDLLPPLSMGLRLREGTGAILALPVLQCAAAIMREMITWDSLGIASPVRTCSGQEFDVPPTPAPPHPSQPS